MLDWSCMEDDSVRKQVQPQVKVPYLKTAPPPTIWMRTAYAYSLILSARSASSRALLSAVVI